ncbi:MAG: zinc-binding metallopeptidase family protein [Planctomycetota bacterium]
MPKNTTTSRSKTPSLRPTAAARRTHESWLRAVTAIPTAAGREQRVIAWVRDWCRARRNLALTEDAAGNLLITQRRRSTAKPLIITAHLDHPAFVVSSVAGRELDLEFRGGVLPAYFDEATIEVIDANDATHTAKITGLAYEAKPFKRVTARLSRKADSIAAGDVGRWRFKGYRTLPVVKKGLLYTHACDDLAAVAAALATLDEARGRTGMAHVGVLLTRAEEVGFIGAIAACRQRTVPRTARLLCLENSRSFPESPIGAGPILRVGDKVSVFSPDLTNRIGQLMALHGTRDSSFTAQRKLMPGGTCEATTFASYGYASTCICLPLGNYHNMSDIDGTLAGVRPALVGPEHISIDDYHGMIELLLLCARDLDDASIPPIKGMMERLWKDVGFVVR